jgi:hypothetical protein
MDDGGEVKIEEAVPDMLSTNDKIANQNTSL